MLQFRAGGIRNSVDPLVSESNLYVGMERGIGCIQLDAANYVMGLAAYHAQLAS